MLRLTREKENRRVRERRRERREKGEERGGKRERREEGKGRRERRERRERRTYWGIVVRFRESLGGFRRIHNN